MRARSFAAPLLLSLLLPMASAQQVLTTMPGQGPGHRFGTSAIEVGDQNGDGIADVVVGAPGHNTFRGAIYCVSGASLGTGSGQILWSTAATWVEPGAEFGASIALAGNLTGSAAPDFVVGAPGFSPNGTGLATGALFVVDGATHQIVTYLRGFLDTRTGAQVVAVGDQTGDGLPDVATNAPSLFSGVGTFVLLVSGAALQSPPGTIVSSYGGWQGGNGFAEVLASGFDLDGDGLDDLALGQPRAYFNGPDAGGLWVVTAKAGSTQLAFYTPVIPGERFGAAVDGRHDYDGDGVVDIVVGAPHWSSVPGAQDGRVVVLSGTALLAHHFPIEMVVLTDPGPNPQPSALHLGAAVRACEDLNGDGVGDIAAGMPDYSVTFPSGPNRGAVAIWSGATFAKLGQVVGANNDRLGDAIAGAVDDLDGDGFPELVFAGTTSDNPSFDCGTLKSARLFPAPPGIYCTPKQNSQGCYPLMSWSGVASATSPAPFLVTCANAINQQPGLMYYAHVPAGLPFQGGFQCVKPPVLRTAAQSSGGSPPATPDCSGAFAFDFNARIQSGVDPTLVVGAEVFCQYWSRDPLSPSSTSLSNGLRFLVNP